MREMTRRAFSLPVDCQTEWVATVRVLAHARTVVPTQEPGSPGPEVSNCWHGINGVNTGQLRHGYIHVVNTARWTVGMVAGTWLYTITLWC